MPLAVPTLSVVDKTDGTGATATISAGDGGASNTISYLRLQDLQEMGPWVAGPVIAGNDTADVAITEKGFYLFKAESVLGSESVTSNIDGATVTDEEDAVHYRMLQAVQARIIMLALADLDNDSIYIRWQPIDIQLLREREANPLGKMIEKDKFPAVMICPAGAETLPTDLNFRDKVGYPIFVAIVDNNNQRIERNLAKYLLWRQRLLRAFRFQRLASVCESFDVTVETGPIVDPQEWASKAMFASWFTLRCMSREPRGI